MAIIIRSRMSKSEPPDNYSNARGLTRSPRKQHEYIMAVAQARYILRKLFRLVEDTAKELGIEPLAHQALLQVYGSAGQALRVGELGERLDITTAFTSNLVKGLVGNGYLVRELLASDARATVLRLTDAGRELCNRIDADVRPHVDYFARQLSADERRIALSTVMFYIGTDAAV